MNIDAEYLDALAALGYDGCEAPFLYLVATHSGFFTLRQFTEFAAQAKGRPAFRFTQKLIQKKHARATEFARRTQVYDIYSRRVYGRIGKDNLRNRRDLSKELIHTRLLILDFVLAHLDCEFLETEAEKVRYFHQTRAIPLTLLPGRIYTGLESNATTTRYFVDRHPIFIASQNFSAAPRPLVSFAYCDLVERDLDAFITHLKNYEELLRHLPAFEFIYACASSDKFKRAGRFFRRFFDLDDSANIENTVRYFEVRRMWDEKKYPSVDRAGRDLLRWGKQHPRQPFLESAYQKWVSGNLGANEIAGVLRPDGGDNHIGFATFVLPHQHDLFERWAGGTGRTDAPRQVSALVSPPLRPASGRGLKQSQ